MFLLVFCHHVVAHQDEHQHGISIQISVNLRKTFFPHILHKENCCEMNLGENLYIFTFSGLYLLEGFDFYLDVIGDQ